MVVLFCKRSGLPQLLEIFLFIREVNEPVIVNSRCY